MTRFLKSNWLRWFAGAFAVGAALPPLLLFGLGCCAHISTLFQMRSRGAAAAIVTNPFLELRNPYSGEAIASGGAALALAAVSCGACAGVLGLCAAKIQHLRCQRAN